MTTETEPSDPRADVEMERAVIAQCIMFAEESVPLVEASLTPEDFSDLRHALLFQVILDVYRRREKVDVLILAAELRERNRLNTIGGAQFIAEVTDVWGSIAFLDRYIARLAELGGARRLRSALRELATRANDPGTPAEELAALVHQRISKATTSRRTGDWRTHRDVVNDLLQRVSEGATADAVQVIRSGFTGLDALMGGFLPASLTVLAARPRIGKTTLAECILHNLAGTGRTVAFFSEEMPADQVANRRIAGNAGVDTRKPLTGKLDADEADAYVHAGAGEFALPILWHSTGRASALDISAIARRMKHMHPDLAMIVVDYVQRLRADDPKAPREQQVGDAAKELKSLATELGVPVVALAQLNRNLESRPDKHPMLADLRDSGQLEQEADYVLFLHREHVYDEKADEGAADLDLAKNRHGPTGRVPLRFDGPRVRFADDPSYLQRIGMDGLTGQSNDDGGLWGGFDAQ